MFGWRTEGPRKTEQVTRVRSSAERIAELDGIRRIAAVNVVLSHCKHVLRNANALSDTHVDECFKSNKAAYACQSVKR